jgi:hypothetical protein
MHRFLPIPHQVKWERMKYRDGFVACGRGATAVPRESGVDTLSRPMALKSGVRYPAPHVLFFGTFKYKWTIDDNGAFYVHSYPSNKPHGLVATKDTFHTSNIFHRPRADKVSLASRHFHTTGVRKVVGVVLPNALSRPPRRESLRKGKWPPLELAKENGVVPSRRTSLGVLS